MAGYDRLENMVAVRFLAWNDDPYKTRTWMEGKNWDAEIEEVNQDIRELIQNPLAEGFLEHMAEKRAELADYTERNKNRQAGHYEEKTVLNDDGKVKTIGHHFYDLWELYIGTGNIDPAREYLTTHDIRAEKMACCGGVRVVIDGREDVAHKDGCPMATIIETP